MLKLYRLIVLLLVSFLSLNVCAQNKDVLEEKKKKIEREINLTNKLLSNAKKEKSLSLNTLGVLNKKINARNELISTLNIELGIYTSRIIQLKKNITKNVNEITQIQKNLRELKNDYAMMIGYAYKNRNSYHRLAFVFSSTSFYQAYKRVRYLQEYGNFLKAKATLIQEMEQKLQKTTTELKETRALLIVERNQKTVALNKAKDLNEILLGEKTEQQVLIGKLKKKEQALKQEIQKKKNIAQQLDKQISKIIAEEIKKARSKTSLTNAKEISLTPEQQKLSLNFNANKTKLPWPVERGVLVEGFGIQAHPILKGIETFNNGVKISTTVLAEARAVFNGKVSRIISIPGAGKAVIISHGEYFTVYSNLSDVFVKVNQRVETKSPLGLVITNVKTKETILELQLWKGNEKLDPAQWLYKAY